LEILEIGEDGKKMGRGGPLALNKEELRDENFIFYVEIKCFCWIFYLPGDLRTLILIGGN